MRLVEQDKPFEDWRSWFFNKRLTGDAVLLGADHQNGRIKLRGALQVDDGAGYFYLPPTFDFLPYEIAEALPFSHYRLCYRRANRDWRLRDETSNRLIFVKDYQGIINLNWWDELSHIHHDGEIQLDTDNIAHLIGSNGIRPAGSCNLAA